MKMGKTWPSCISMMHARTHLHFRCLMGLLVMPFPCAGASRGHRSLGPSASEGPPSTCDILERLEAFLPSFCPDSYSFAKQTLTEHLCCVTCPQVAQDSREGKQSRGTGQAANSECCEVGSSRCGERRVALRAVFETETRGHWD